MEGQNPFDTVDGEAIGWAEQYDDHGQAYYYNIQTQETKWELPDEENDPITAHVSPQLGPSSPSCLRTGGRKPVLLRALSNQSENPPGHMGLAGSRFVSSEDETNVPGQIQPD